MHVPGRADFSRESDGTIRFDIEPGRGTAPDVKAALRPVDGEPGLPPEWGECFGDWKGFLGYCVPQDRAMCCQDWYGRVVRQEIDLGIPLETCRPLEGTVESRAARAIIGDAEPVCFLVPAVRFLFEREEYDNRATEAAGPVTPPMPVQSPAAL